MDELTRFIAETPPVAHHHLLRSLCRDVDMVPRALGTGPAWQIILRNKPNINNQTNLNDETETVSETDDDGRPVETSRHDYGERWRRTQE